MIKLFNKTKIDIGMEMIGSQGGLSILEHFFVWHLNVTKG